MYIKLQHIQQQGVTFDGVLKAGYDLNYTYGSKPHQIDNIKDENYRTEANDAKKLKKTENVYEYDENGNLIFVSKNKKKDEKQNERKLLWDEENRLEAVSDNGFVSLYTYDAGGERVAKLSGNGESVYVNSLKSGARTQTNKYTAYISPYFVLSSGGQYTKHIMIGSQRIVSKLGDVGSFGQDPRRIEYAGTTESIKVDYKTKYQKSQQIFRDRYKASKVVYNGVDNNDYRGGDSFCCGKKKDGFKARSSDGGITNNDKPELYQYYYHPDHLGSSSYITNLDGEVAQHIEYVPFGEVFLNEQNNRWNTPYLFNGKELDEETGLYYYGARYYNPRESVWLSVDPLALYDPVMEVEHYIDGEHNGGYSNPRNLSVYGYTYQNPVVWVDPNGKQVFVVHGTTQNTGQGVFSGEALREFKRIGGNKTVNSNFSWHAPLLNNATFHRALAAKKLADYVVKNRKEGEPITLLGYSHGGNVSIQATDLIKERTGENVNLITVSAPAYKTHKSLKNTGLSGLEDPNKKTSINSHIQIVHENDAVTSFWAQGSDTYEEGKSTHSMKNYIILEGQIKLKGGIKAHTKLPNHKGLPKELNKIPKIKN